jgi:hypothetical protein
MDTRRIIFRVAYSLLIGVLLAWGMNELTYRLLKTGSSRAPKTIELVIPAGTAEKVVQGQGQPTIPKNMIFVVGDTLVVRNADTKNHQLGPLFIPAGTSASLGFSAVEKYAYSCSFVPGNYLGLDVQLPVTALTRLTGAIFAGLPLGVLIALYSLIVSSSRKKAAA